MKTPYEIGNLYRIRVSSLPLWSEKISNNILVDFQRNLPKNDVVVVLKHIVDSGQLESTYVLTTNGEFGWIPLEGEIQPLVKL